MAGTRRITYSVAMSLDGYITGPRGEIDWIVMDPEIDFAELFAGFDTIVMGRRSYDEARRMDGGPPSLPTHVISRTLRQEDCPGVIVSSDLAKTIDDLRAAPGSGIWLFGGGELFRQCLEIRAVDAVQVAIVPVLLGGGTPMLPTGPSRVRLELQKHRLYSGSGTMLLDYVVRYD